jgi:hypothetical protein
MLYSILLISFFFVFYIAAKIISKNHKLYGHGIVTGVVIMVTAQSLTQDIYGKQAFLEWANTHWANPWITVPLAIFLVVAWLAGEYIDFRGDKEV